jgi:hypothetical protein
MNLEKVISNFFGVLKITDEKSRSGSGSLVRGTVPQIRIRTKVSRIRNTGLTSVRASLLIFCCQSR